MKKTYLVVVGVLMAFGITGCGKVEPPDGIWVTASVGYEYDGVSQPEYYVQFTDTEIQYKHRNDEELVPDHANQIVSLKNTPTGGYIIQAETSDGGQYTYRSNESDENILEYYSTWDEEEFPHQYNAGASLWKLTSTEDMQ